MQFRAANFFKFTAEDEGKFDVILDYTFLWCAVCRLKKPSRWFILTFF